MKNIHLSEIKNKDLREYRTFIQTEDDAYLLVIAPIGRMGCKSLRETSGAVTVELFKKNESYPEQWRFSDQVCVHAAGGKDLGKEVIKTLNHCLIETGIITKDQPVFAISFSQDDEVHYLKGTDEKLCSRCLTPVSYENISEGYVAVCNYHEEDLLSVEMI